MSSYQTSASSEWSGRAKNSAEPFIKAAVVHPCNSEGHFLSSNAQCVLTIFQRGSESRARGEVGTPSEAAWSRVKLITVKVQPRFLNVFPTRASARVHEREARLYPETTRIYM